MESLRFKLHFLVFFAIASLMVSITNSSQKNDHVALFIFGDSLFDVGNNNYLKNAVGRGNFFPYGETFFKYPTGRFSDGRLIPDFIAEYLKLPLISPYLEAGNNQYTNGVNFASGGAGALVETYQGMVIDLNTQLTHFKNVEKQLRQELGDEETNNLLSKAIFLISIGSNDYLFPYNPNYKVLHNYSREKRVEMVIGNLITVLKEIYKHGGRKFGILSLLGLGCIPLTKAINKQFYNSSGCIEEVSILVKLHNGLLSKVLEELNKELKGFEYSNFNMMIPVNERINNPAKYGFKEAKMACCGSGPYRGIPSCGGQGAIKEYKLCENPSDYLFFDGSHPSEKFNKQLAALFWSGSDEITSPYNLKELSNNA